MKKSFFILCLFILPLSWSELFAELDEVNDIFNKKEEQIESNQDENEALTSLFKKGINLNADFSLLAGYSFGLNYFPWELENPAAVEYKGTFVFDLQASLSAVVNFSPQFRFIFKTKAQIPLLELEVAELFADYNLWDIFFFRVGRQIISWHISPNFAFADLLSRVPDDLAQDSQPTPYDNLAFKITIPIGIGGLDLLAFTRTCLWEDKTSPQLEDLGAGLRLNLAFENIDLSLATYYHPKLLWRSLTNFKTTLLSAIELYCEVVLSSNWSQTLNFALTSWYLSLNTGFYVEFWERRLRLNVEYFYSSEQEELTVIGQDYPLMPGHNLALNLILKIAAGFQLVFQGKYNFEGQTGLLVSAANIELANNLNLIFGLPIYLGSLSEGYALYDVQKLNCRISCFIGLNLKGSI